MASPATGLDKALLTFETGTAETRRVYLTGAQLRVGRSSANELSFIEDAQLSREHLLFERLDQGWTVRDLRSKNGTRVNGSRISKTVELAHGDVISAGRQTMTFIFDNIPWKGHTAILHLDDSTASLGDSRTFATNLRSALARTDPGNLDRTERAHLEAFVRASRELVSHRPLGELFQVLLDISVDAVHASRGVVVTRDRGRLTIRAHRRNGFHISSAIVDRVLDRRESLLILDAAKDVDLAGRDSIMHGQVGSCMAVPLQTTEDVMGLIYVDCPANCPEKGGEFTPEDLNLLTVMANIAAVRIEHTRLLEIEEEGKGLAGELLQAAEIQRALLPDQAPQVENFDIAGYNAASRTVGGDYYDFLELPEGEIGLVVADVVGKGMPAALLMASLHARVHIFIDGADELTTRVARLNRAISADFPDNRFVTFFIGALSPQTGCLRFCNAGHNPPILLHSSGAVETLQATGLVLGVLPGFESEEAYCQMQPGDALVLFSDGVTEACDSENQEFGEARLVEVLRARRTDLASEIVDAVTAEVVRFTGGAPLADDLTLVVARRLS